VEVDDSYDADKILIMWAGKVQITSAEASRFFGEYEYDTSTAGAITKVKEMKYSNSLYDDFSVQAITYYWDESPNT
jgi:hypothetical protein